MLESVAENSPVRIAIESNFDFTRSAYADDVPSKQTERDTALSCCLQSTDVFGNQDFRAHAHDMTIGEPVIADRQ